MESSPAMDAFMKKAAGEQGIATDGFARAFLEATGLRAHEAEMMVESGSVGDPLTHEYKMVQRIWFQKRVR